MYCKIKYIVFKIKILTVLLLSRSFGNVIYNTTNNNTYLILFIIFLIGFIVFLIGFIYYCRRSNFDRKKLKDFIYPKTSIY